jgi:hypothetical protein
MGGDELLRYLGALGYSVDLVGREVKAPRPRSVAEIISIFDDSPGDHIDLIAWRQ